jgi:hypothetical protein
VMQVLPGWLHHKGADYSWTSKVSGSLGVQYDSRNEFWKNGLPYRFEDLIRAAPNNSGFSEDSSGFTLIGSRGWSQDAGIFVENDWELDNPEYKANLVRMEDFAKTVAARGIHLVLVNFPTSPAYKGQRFYGPYGPRTEVAAEVLRKYRDLEKISPLVHFYDAQLFGDHDYGDADALDAGHLSSEGAGKLTSRLDSLINTFP